MSDKVYNLRVEYVLSMTEARVHDGSTDDEHTAARTAVTA